MIKSDLNNFNLHITELIEDLNKNNNDYSHLQRKFEMFCLKYERNLIPINDFNDIEKILSKIFYINKTMSIHFDGPILIGSFINNCHSIKNKFIDILFTHKLTVDDFKKGVDQLLKNFNMIFNDTNSQPLIKFTNEKDELNYVNFI